MGNSARGAHTESSTTNATTTTTTIGNLGFTGQNAVDLASNLAAANVADLQSLMGGAESLFQNVADVTVKNIDAIGKIADDQSQQNRDVLSAAASLAGKANPSFAATQSFDKNTLVYGGVLLLGTLLVLRVGK